MHVPPSFLRALALRQFPERMMNMFIWNVLTVPACILHLQQLSPEVHICMHVCVCVCVCLCMRLCVCACICVCGRLWRYCSSRCAVVAHYYAWVFPPHENVWIRLSSPLQEVRPRSQASEQRVTLLENYALLATKSKVNAEKAVGRFMEMASTEVCVVSVVHACHGVISCGAL